MRLSNWLFFALGCLIFGAFGCSDASSESNIGTATSAESSCEESAAEGAAILAECTSCHSADLTGGDRQGATRGIDFDTEVGAAMWAERIRVRAIEQRTMPPGAPLSDCEATALGLYLDELADVCVPNCDGLSCGDDGCGRVCGECAEGEICSAGTCEPDVCEPDCSAAVCGDDGCGGSCGSCNADEVCEGGACACVPNCDGKMCGPDGCGGSCGECAGMLVCNTVENRCVANCTPNCLDRICGDDGCGGSCGPCGADEACNGDGTMCVCVPQCQGKTCGPDGCGGSCGMCTGANEICTDAGVCECTPECNGAVCGPDGCGGTCGNCAPGEACDAGSCAYPEVTWSGDVFPIFQQIGCGSLRCHGGVAPAAGLDLSDSATAYSEMVGVASSQCTPGRSLVEPSVPSTSYLVDKLVGTNLCFGSKMPKVGTVTPAEIDQVRAWIGRGALND